MAMPQPPLGGGGPQVPPSAAAALAKASGSKWSALGSSMVIFAFSLRLLGDKYDHQAEQAALKAELDAARADVVSLRAELDAAYAGKKRPPPAAPAAAAAKVPPPPSKVDGPKKTLL